MKHTQELVLVICNSGAFCCQRQIITRKLASGKALLSPVHPNTMLRADAHYLGCILEISGGLVKNADVWALF